jgi:hypothetical protein
MPVINYENFKEYYKLNGWTQTSIAKLLGVDQSALSQYMRTGKPLPGKWIIVIRDRMKLSAGMVNWLLLGGEEPDRTGTAQKSKAEIIGEAMIEIVNRAQAI